MTPDYFPAMSTNLPRPLSSGSNGETETKEQPLRAAARALETSFIAEMLKSTGIGKSRESFGGGAGEEGFSSFLVTAQAEKISEAGGFGLAEKIFQSLVNVAKDDA